jgi:hypothetical protein
MKALTFSAIALGFVGLLIAILMARSNRPLRIAHEASPSIPRAAMPTVGGAVVNDRIDSPVYEKPAPPAPKERSAQSIHEASVRATLIQYRTATASGSRLISKKLLTSLRKHQDLAIRIAQDDLSKAKSDAEQKSLRDALEAIRR